MKLKFIYRNPILAVDEHEPTTADCTGLRQRFRQQHQTNRNLRVCVWTVGAALYILLVAAVTILLATHHDLKIR